ncbi:MAG TPA: ParB/RepB/Spo0J family partition protein [Candidatus Deferrimicrobiaceae bacterium]|nr:ParB/RepB/Spo0J family partition protein [Candidatus Deferrimicrobiaceae bacterium]
MKKKVLGRGLSALLTSTTPSAAAPGAGRDPGFLQIPLEKIRAGSLQPRRTFSPEPLEELVASIREKGILQPVLVRPTPDGYELVAGERRFRAAESAGLSTIPAVVRKLTDREALEAALVENVQRTDLNAIELAEGYQRLAHDFSLSQEQVAERVGKDRVTVANTVRLLRLPSPVRQAVVDGRLTAGHARALLSAPPEHAPAICETVIRRGLSVRETERLCGAAVKRTTARRPAPPDAHRKSLEEELSRRGGTRVRLRGTLKKGRVEISYFSPEELDRLCTVLFGGR